MTAGRVYLDYNATAPLRPAARAAVVAALDSVGNPSSVHAEGRAARKFIEDAREQVAALVATSPANVVFTSGATEANNWVLNGGWETIYLPAIEHDSVLAPARASGARAVVLTAGSDGLTRVGELAEAVLSSPADAGRSLAVLQMANNETGVVQPVAETAAFCQAHDIAFHCDAVQAAGRIAIAFDELGGDSMSLSSHKLGGPMGVGALMLRDGWPLAPLITGGGQERRRRSGTENVAAIAGFGAAAACAAEDLAAINRTRAMRDRLERELCAIAPATEVVGAVEERLANTTCLMVPGTSSETLLIKLDLAGIAVSSGSACSSGKVGASHVLAAMGVAGEMARGAIRISLGWKTSEADVDAFLRVWNEVMGQGAKAVA